MLLVLILTVLGNLRISNALNQFAGVQSTLARSSLLDSVTTNRALLSCEWECLKRKCNILADDALSGALLKQIGNFNDIPESEYTYWAVEKEVCGKASNTGRPAVQAALSRFQRMIMQLDRSDGVGAAVNPGEFAARYVDLINTCTRTGGGAWTAALSGINYAGLNLSSFLKRNSNMTSINVHDLALQCESRLLDFGKDSLNWSEIGRCSILQCQDMIACILQIAIRLAILEEQLESVDGPVALKPITSELRIECLDVDSKVYSFRPYLPPSCVIASLLKNDFGFDFEIETAEDSRFFIVSTADVTTWVKANSLF